MICYVTINDLFLEFDNIHGAKISIIFEICKFYLKIIGNIKYNFTYAPCLSCCCSVAVLQLMF